MIFWGVAKTSCLIESQIAGFEFKAQSSCDSPVVGLRKTTRGSVRTVEPALKVDYSLANHIIRAENIVVHHLQVQNETLALPNFDLNSVAHRLRF